VYHSEAQVKGLAVHEAIDKGKYSSSKRYIQALPVYSAKYNLTGKIDIYDCKTKFLIERKYQISKVYRGHEFQLYAQMVCMQEMGYEVEGLKIHSQKDNKNYLIALPQAQDWVEFAETIQKMRNFRLRVGKDSLVSKLKCERSIYKELSF
jgi:CRISPR-associated protein Cas4